MKAPELGLCKRHLKIQCLGYLLGYSEILAFLIDA